MRIYTEPELKIFEFDTEEILTLSGGGDPNPTPTPGMNVGDGDGNDTSGEVEWIHN